MSAHSTIMDDKGKAEKCICYLHLSPNYVSLLQDITVFHNLKNNNNFVIRCGLWHELKNYHLNSENINLLIYNKELTKNIINIELVWKQHD